MIGFLAALAVIVIGILLISIRILLVPNGEFRGTCSTNSPYLQREGGDCPVCGKKAGETDCQLSEDEKEKLKDNG